MANTKFWGGLFLVFVWSALTVDFRTQLSLNDTFIHLIIINIFLILLIHPPEEFITALDLSLEGIIKCFKANSKFLEYACFRILCYQTSLFLFPLANSAYFLHGQYFTKGNVRRFHSRIDYPIVYSTIFIGSLIGAIGFFIFNYDFRNWRFFKIFQNIQDEEADNFDTLNSRINWRNSYMINISKTLNKAIYLDEQYFLYVTNFSLVVSRVSDVTITVIDVRMHTLREEDQDERNQIIKVNISFADEISEPITLALRGSIFQEIYNQHILRISVPENIQLQPNIADRFIVAFSSRVKENQICRGNEELESCFGCGGNGNQVVLRKKCDNHGDEVYENIVGEIIDIPPCEECRCRPMWCVSCMARVFLAKQPKVEKHRWMQGVANCPTCRKTFCIKDVQLYENIV
ncbi:unnamed protein product [Caenorhabditis angaria]|uniref:Uncharacterized protein n=1 Tax=Caenorhabditis angaria TaxID=860376 RepID=A0A9P1J3T8_9PELO|nr:unnamed protein product [Caenorhabditis angaria]